MAGAIPLAHAQTQVLIYGVADAGLVLERGGSAGNVTEISSGVGSGNRLGLKGREELGGGMAAFFNLENGYNIDTGTAGQGGLLFGRQAYVGLSGAVGSIAFGRQYSPYYKAMRDVADPFEIGLAGNSLNVMAGNTRVDNMVSYQTPRFQGWFAELAYGAGETAGDTSRNRSIGAALGYAEGAVSVRLVHHRRENATATDYTSNSLLAAKLNFDFLSGHLAYARNRGLGGTQSHDTLLGITAPLGRHKILASFILHRDGTASRDARQRAAAYLYGLSRRTDLYAAYGHILNENGAAFRVGNGTDTGSGPTAIDLGVRHTF